MNTSGNNQTVVVLSAGIKEVLASSLSTLGRFHNDEYVLNRHCLASVKDIIRFLRRDNESYEIRRYLGQAKVVQNDLIHIIKSCPSESEELFDLTLRLLTILTNSVVVLYGEEVPAEKIGRSIYMNLIEHLQDYKEAFYDTDFWSVICGKLTDLFEIDWSERSESQCLQIEKMLVLLRNVLHIPADPEREKITENDISVHDKILWSLRQSQILEFLLYVSSNKTEQRYYLHLLEIFSLILREQNPKLLAVSEVQMSTYEREKDMKDLLALREREKMHKNTYKNTRTFDSTLVLKGLKSFSGKDMIYHGSLEDMKQSVVPKDKKRGKPRNHKMPVQSEQVERRSSFSVRIFLKEFCIEFLNCSYNNLMSVVKEKLLSGKGLPNDEIFYFWALKFFLEFNCTYNLDIKLISDSVNVQTFHFLQTNMEENFEKLVTEKSKRVLWVRKLHLILKAYHSLLQTLKWMDSSKDASIREMSSVLKSQIFYVSEYRDMALSFLTRYDTDLFSIPYLRDLIETTHIAMKLLEDYTKRNKIVVRKRIRKKTGKKKKKAPKPEKLIYESNQEKWERIKDEVHRVLLEENDFPDVPPFDVLLELSDEEQKERTMKNIQKLLHEGKIIDGIGLLFSARKLWPENDHFGRSAMSVENELMGLKELCVAELGNEKVPVNVLVQEEKEEGVGNDKDEEEGGDVDDDDNDDEEEGDHSDDDLGDTYKISEESFDMMNYKKQLVNKRVVEACATLLQNYAKNSDYTNHCVIKILFRIGWECSMPAMMYQASLFWTLLTVMNDKYKNYREIKDFAIHLIRKFGEHAKKNKFAFLELLFWKDPSVAISIQDQCNSMYEFEDEGQSAKKGRKAASWSVEEEDELQRLWNECNSEFPIRRKIEWIKKNLIDESKSLLAVKKKLKELGLVSDNVRAARLNIGKEWLEEEQEELTRIFNECRDAIDVVSVIADRLTLKRTKKSIKQKLLELGLVSSLAQLKKRNTRHSRKPLDDDDSESSEEDENEAVDVIHEYSVQEQRATLKKVQHMKTALEWLKGTIEESIDEDDEETESYPVLAIEKDQIEALENEDFILLMRSLGLEEPASSQVYWKIPKIKSKQEQALNLLNSAISGDLPAEEDDESEDEFEKLRKMMRPSRENRTNEVPSMKNRSRTKVPRKKKAAVVESDDESVRSSENIGEPPRNVLDSSDDEITRSKVRSRAIRSDSESDEEPSAITRRIDPEKAFDRLIASHSPRRATEESENSLDDRNCVVVESGTPDQTGTDKDLEESVTPIKSTKRRRFISSDSESEDDKSEKLDVANEKRKKKRLVDSDSDADADAD